MTLGCEASRSRYRGKTSFPPSAPRKKCKSGTASVTVIEGPEGMTSVVRLTRKTWRGPRDCHRAGRSPAARRGSWKVHCRSKERYPYRTMGSWGASARRSASLANPSTRVKMFLPVPAVWNRVSREGPTSRPFSRRSRRCSSVGDDTNSAQRRLKTSRDGAMGHRRLNLHPGCCQGIRSARAGIASHPAEPVGGTRRSLQPEGTSRQGPRSGSRDSPMARSAASFSSRPPVSRR